MQQKSILYLSANDNAWEAGNGSVTIGRRGKEMVSVMNRQEFMERLENLLQNIPEQERVEAIQYYNDYFEDAGEENEQAVLDALGTPAQVAENIKRDMNQNRYTYDCEQEKVSQGKEVIKYQPEL